MFYLSFFKGDWWGYMQNNRFLIKLFEEILGMPVFNSGPHKEYFKGDSKEFGHYNPMFLEKVIKKFKSLSPASKQIIQPFYDSHFKIPLRELMKNQIPEYFLGEFNKNFIEKIRKKVNHKSLLDEIKSNNSNIPPETLFWIRRNYDGISDKFLQLFKLIIDEFDGVNPTFLEKYNNTIWTDGSKILRFRKLSSIKYSESTKEIKGYVFDGFLKKSAGNGKLYNDKGYFIIQDKIENLKNIYDINAKSGLNVRESPSTSGKIVDKLEYGISVKILNKTGEPFEVEGIKGEWVEIKTYSPPFGHRQELFPDNQGMWAFTYKVDELFKYLECNMCGYKSINENVFNKLSFHKESVGDYGPVTSVTNTFSINNGKLIEVESYSEGGIESSSQTIWVPIDSDSIDIERIKDKNKIMVKEYTQKELDSISERKNEIREIAEEEFNLEEATYWYLNEANIIENPKNAMDFYNNGMIKYIRLNEVNNSIEDLHKAIELNGDKNEWISKDAYFYLGNILNFIDVSDEDFESACNYWKKAANLGMRIAEKLVREKCKNILLNDQDKIDQIVEKNETIIKDTVEEVNKFPGTDFYTLKIEGKSKIYDYDSYQIITTDLSYITGYPELNGEQIKIYSKDDESIEFTIGDENNEVLFGGIVQGFMIIKNGGMFVGPEIFSVFDLQNQKIVFDGSHYYSEEWQIVNSKIEYYEVIDSPNNSYYAERYEKFTKPKCSEELEKIGKIVPGSIGYIEKLIYDIATQQLERTGLYESAYFQ